MPNAHTTESLKFDPDCDHAEPTDGIYCACGAASFDSYFYVEYRSGNCSMISAPTEAVARFHAREFADAFRTRVAFVRLATRQDRDDFDGAIYRVAS